MQFFNHNIFKMTEKELENKIKVKALLETYSTKDICKIFTTIDSKIYSLHECSSDDFLRLNNDFKQLYNQSKLISENVAEIFNILNTNKNKLLYNEIYTYCEKVIENTKTFDHNLIVIIDFLKDLSNQLRFVFFPVKNYGQNLMSLKYLIANLNLTVSYSKENSDALKSFKRIEENINGLKSLLEKIPKIVNASRKISRIITSNFALGKETPDTNIESILNAVKSSIGLIERKYKANENNIPDIRKKTDKSAENISDIIKKLQYQDIIKQKMEHIQHTHKDLINELYEFENTSDEEKYINEKAKFFLRIRDIAGLQAAQLIHANKEYQSALEIIINNFIQIGDNMKIISQLCNDIVADNQNDEERLFDEIVQNIKRSEECYFNKNNQNKKLYKELNSIEYQLTQSEKSFALLNELNNDLNININQYFKEIEKLSEHDENIKQSLIQLKSLYKDIQQNGLKLIGFNGLLAPLKKHVQSLINDKTDTSLNKNFERIEKAVSHLHSLRFSLDSKLKENQDISNGVLNGIKKSISEIKYYDFFEKIIDEIITELNTINYNLKIDDEEISSKEENLKKLKSYYTMQTEHLIHEQVEKGEKADIESDDNGEIEFF